MTQKICIDCCQLLDIEEFYKSAGKYRQTRCKSCYSDRYVKVTVMSTAEEDMKYPKDCINCKVSQPKENFYKSGKYRQLKCKKCSRSRYKTLKPKIESIKIKECKSCNRELEIDEFYVITGKYRRGICKDCCKMARKSKSTCCLS